MSELMTKHEMTEEDIKLQYITPAIESAGWDKLKQIKMEYNFTDGRVIVRGNVTARGKRKRTDYLLYYKPNIPLAIVEAKDNRHSVGAGMQQAIEYAEVLDIPFVYSSNGDGFLEHDMKSGKERELMLEQFPSPHDLWQRHIGDEHFTPEQEQLITEPYYFQLGDKTPRYYQRIAINRTVDAVARGHDRILVEARMATDLLKTSDQYCVELKNLLNLYEIDPKSVEGVIISSVVPPVLNSCKTAVRKLTGKTPMIVGPGIKTGLNIQMENPAQIGSDLIVAAVAALSRFKPPLIIVDMGTATTMTAIDKNGTYVGGCISPGPKLSAESLSTRTAQLPAISLESPKKAIGKNTVDAMRSGVMLGSACMVDGMIDRMEEELGGGVTVVATGGIARFVLPMCRRRIEYDRDLLLKGLSILYENNRREK